jgi:hypothetical protein
VTDQSASLIDFLESHLGEMSNGFLFEGPQDRPIQVARFDHQPVSTAVTLVTTGLSKHVLHQLSPRDIRMELLACAYSEFDIPDLAKVVFALAQEILEKHHAPARGDVIGPRGPICSGSNLEALYFSHPAYHSAGLDKFEGDPPETIIAWIVPISASEAAYIHQHGWSAFEELVESKEPDLLDMKRPSLA